MKKVARLLSVFGIIVLTPFFIIAEIFLLVGLSWFGGRSTEGEKYLDV